MAKTMFALPLLLGTYAAASYVYAIRCLMTAPARGRAAKHLLIFMLWNIVAAIALRSIVSFWLAGNGSHATILTSTLVSITPHIIVLAGNIANWFSAMRAGIARPIILLLGIWIVVSVFTIMLLGTISPVTALLNVLP